MSNPTTAAPGQAKLPAPAASSPAPNPPTVATPGSYIQGQPSAEYKLPVKPAETAHTQRKQRVQFKFPPVNLKTVCKRTFCVWWGDGDDQKIEQSFTPDNSSTTLLLPGDTPVCADLIDMGHDGNPVAQYAAEFDALMLSLTPTPLSAERIN